LSAGRPKCQTTAADTLRRAKMKRRAG
jgi:hypothetical protein